MAFKDWKNLFGFKKIKNNKIITLKHCDSYKLIIIKNNLKESKLI